MSDEEKDKINLEDKVEEVVNEKDQLEGESAKPESQTTESSDSATVDDENKTEVQSKVEEKKENEVIHKKDGRLHIYVRQDKYKGELKSKNWVGRLYIDGKQKISSSGTPNLDDAIPILEKWFDFVHASKEKEEKISQETAQTTSEQPSIAPKQTTPPVIETSEQTESVTEAEKKPELATEDVVSTQAEPKKESLETKSASNILEKFKNIKFKKPSFGKQDSVAKNSSSGKKGIRKKLESFFKAKLGKSAVQGEEIVGVELAATEIRLAQLSNNKGLYISILTDPTTGGVTASYAMQADIIISEPNALIGFAGARVIKQTIGQDLPKGFQRAEFLINKGFIDSIIPRSKLKRNLSDIINFFKEKNG